MAKILYNNYHISIIKYTIIRVREGHTDEIRLQCNIFFYSIVSSRLHFLSTEIEMCLCYIMLFLFICNKDANKQCDIKINTAANRQE